MRGRVDMTIRHSGVSRRGALAGGMSLLASGLSGCTALTQRNGIGEAALQRRAVVSGLPGIRVWGDEVPADIGAAFRSAHGFTPASSRTADGRPLVNILALSGGGTDGAFGAGFLAGWSARGTRPNFEVVTGVSAGAIIAPLAFLGPSQDRALKQIWTETKLTELVVILGIGGLLNGTAVADTAPLAAAIAKYVTPRLLRAIAAEHARGRLLLIGTTNLDAQRPVVWNMTAIAASRHPDALELFRKVVLASASIPALFPPVPIQVEVDGKVYDEMHVDGGTTRNVFVAPFPVLYQAFDKFYPSPPQRRVFLLNNSKLSPEPEVVTPQTLSIAARAIYTLLKSHHHGEIAMIYSRARESGADFNLAAVPDDFDVPGAPLGDPAYESALYETGMRIGGSAAPWLKAPPVIRARKV
jgi:predicted acylesterase/phospholipase RssA